MSLGRENSFHKMLWLRGTWAEITFPSLWQQSSWPGGHGDVQRERGAPKGTEADAEARRKLGTWVRWRGEEVPENFLNGLLGLAASCVKRASWPVHNRPQRGWSSREARSGNVQAPGHCESLAFSLFRYPQGDCEASGKPELFSCDPRSTCHTAGRLHVLWSVLSNSIKRIVHTALFYNKFPQQWPNHFPW